MNLNIKLAVAALAAAGALSSASAATTIEVAPTLGTAWAETSWGNRVGTNWARGQFEQRVIGQTFSLTDPNQIVTSLSFGAASLFGASGTVYLSSFNQGATVEQLVGNSLWSGTFSASVLPGSPSFTPGVTLADAGQYTFFVVASTPAFRSLPQSIGLSTNGNGNGRRDALENGTAWSASRDQSWTTSRNGPIPVINAGFDPIRNMNTDLSFRMELTAVPVTPPVPEPAEWAMLMAGLGVVGTIARRRGRTAKAA